MARRGESDGIGALEDPEAEPAGAAADEDRLRAHRRFAGDTAVARGHRLPVGTRHHQRGRGLALGADGAEDIRSRIPGVAQCARRLSRPARFRLSVHSSPTRASALRQPRRVCCGHVSAARPDPRRSGGGTGRAASACPVRCSRPCPAVDAVHHRRDRSRPPLEVPSREACMPKAPVLRSQLPSKPQSCASDPPPRPEAHPAHAADTSAANRAASATRGGDPGCMRGAVRSARPPRLLSRPSSPALRPDRRGGARAGRSPPALAGRRR